MQIKDITNHLELLAPLAYQEDYDNAGLIVGNQNAEVTGVLVCLDSTEAVVDEAIERGCNLIIAHHPIVFKGLKKLTGKNYIERTIIKAIKNDIAIYASHTNLDSVTGGVNFKIAAVLGLKNIEILSQKANSLKQLVVFTPIENTSKLLNALHLAGAGQIGNYSECSFRVLGEGTFRPNEIANPAIGSANHLEKVAENRIEVIFPTYLQSKMLAAMREAHVYEEVAYFLNSIENKNQTVGSGVVGEFENEMSSDEFLKFLKAKMKVGIIKHTAFLGKKIKKIALCGGAGSFLLNDAIAAQADVFITSDYKYHEFFDADNKLQLQILGIMSPNSSQKN